MRRVVLAGEEARAGLDLRRVRGPREGLPRPLAVVPRAGAPHRGRVLPALLLRPRAPGRAAGVPRAPRHPRHRAGGAVRASPHRPRTPREGPRPRGAPAAVPGPPGPRALHRLERAVPRLPAVQRGPAPLPALLPPAPHLPHGTRGPPRRAVAGRRGAVRAGLRVAAVEGRRSRRGGGCAPRYRALPGSAARRPRRGRRVRRERVGGPGEAQSGDPRAESGCPPHGRRGRLRHSVPREEGGGPRGPAPSRARPGPRAAEAGQVLLHLW